MYTAIILLNPQAHTTTEKVLHKWMGKGKITNYYTTIHTKNHVIKTYLTVFKP